MDDWIRLGIFTLSILGAVVWISRWFGKHEEWMKGVNEFKSETKSSLAGIRDDIKKILVALPRNVLAGTSPVQLTELGKEVSKSVRASAWAERKAPQLVDHMKDKTAYDVQKYCFEYLKKESVLEPDDDKAAKECAFQHGIKLEQVLDVFAVELRDRLLHRGEEAPS